MLMRKRKETLNETLKRVNERTELLKMNESMQSMEVSTSQPAEKPLEGGSIRQIAPLPGELKPKSNPYKKFINFRIN